MYRLEVFDPLRLVPVVVADMSLVAVVVAERRHLSVECTLLDPTGVDSNLTGFVDSVLIHTLVACRLAVRGYCAIETPIVTSAAAVADSDSRSLVTVNDYRVR